MTVHNHGTEEGKGLACRESRVNGMLRGECMTRTIKITPESLGRPLTADDVQEGDTIAIDAPNGSRIVGEFAVTPALGHPGIFFMGRARHLLTMLIEGWGITSISREVADVPEPAQLPSATGFYQDKYGSIWSRYGDTFLMVGVDEELDLLGYAPFTRLIPADPAHDAAIREAALRDLLADIESSERLGSFDSPREVIAYVRALVPVAGEKK